MRTAIYCRVSTDRQEHEETIQSQLESLRKYAGEKGYEVVGEYKDDGYSGMTLKRPGLDKLRDALCLGDFELVLVHSPDRLARKAIYQGLILEELAKAGMGIEFFNHPVDDTPEGKMLLGMQGLFAEYERAKTLERTRRGKLHWARQGAVVCGRAPYGYRFVKRCETSRAKLEIDEAQAPVVKDIYRWLLSEQMSTRAIASRLTTLGVPTAAGATQWAPTVVSRILRNPAYHGEYIYQRSERVVSPNRRTSNLYRQHEKNGYRPRPAEDWITIPVEPLVSTETWRQAQDQLRRNSLHSPRNDNRHQYLLRGLLRCSRCGSTYSGHNRRGNRYYRCRRTDAALSSTGQKCSPGSVNAELVEQAVWRAVAEALKKPDVLMEEYQRRLAQAGSDDGLEAERKQLLLAQKRVKAQEDRLTDAYVNEAIDLHRYKEEMGKFKQRRQALEQTAKEHEKRERLANDSQKALEYLEQFCDRVAQGLDSLTFEERQKLLRLVVERITVENGHVHIESIIPAPGDSGQLRTRHPERSEESPTPNHCALRSSHPGFNDSTSSIFLARSQPLICFSRAMAACTSHVSSQ